MDPITAEVISNKLGAVADEMSVVLVRSSVSTNIKERNDCSTALFDSEARLLYQAENIPLHLGSLQGMVEAVAHRFAGRIRPGDMFIGNDPFEGGGTHLPDIVLVAPVFHEERLAGFVTNLGHHADFVQRKHRHVFEEGLRIPPVPIQHDSEWIEDTFGLIMTNFQVPEERRADLGAQVAANRVGVAGLERVVEQYGFETFGEAVEELLSHAERQMSEAIKNVPEGAYRWGEQFDCNELEDVIDLRVTAIAEGGELHLDFEAPPQVEAGFNMVETALLATCYYAVKSLLAPHLLPNAGMFRPLHISAPSGSVLNAVAPAAVFTRSQLCQRVVDLVYGALQQALPHLSRGQTNGTNTMIVVSGNHPSSGFYGYVETMGGGGGAGPDEAGVNGVQVHITNTSNLPVESLEFEYPLEVVEYGLIAGSGGSGKHPGGEGIRRRLRVLSKKTNVEYSGTRLRTLPQGAQGGGAARPGRCWVEQRDGTVVEHSSSVDFAVGVGEVVGIDTPGGGGFGASE